MARWKLINAHHLKVPGTEWEYKEMDRNTGREKRMRIEVPRFLDPKDPQDWTNRWGNKDNQEGEIIVCYAGRGDPHDIVFEGDPTPDMIPMDDEATEISASFAGQWQHPVDAIPGSFNQSLIDNFQSQMAEIKEKPAQIEGMQELLSVLASSVKQNAELIAALSKPAERRL